MRFSTFNCSALFPHAFPGTHMIPKRLLYTWNFFAIYCERKYLYMYIDIRVRIFT